MVEFRKVIRKRSEPQAQPALSAMDRGEPPLAAADGQPAKQLELDRSAQDFYLEGLALSAAALEWAAKGGPGGFPLQKPVEHFIDVVLNILESPEAWRLLALSRAFSQPSYIPSHSLNVCILASYMALRSGFKDKQAFWISGMAFLHDIGLSCVPKVWDTPNKLTTEEKKLIHPHPVESLRIIENTGCCEDGAFAAGAMQHHERIDGSGYPEGKKATDMTIAAHVIGATDVFSAMTQPRSYRGAIAPFDVVRTISHMAGRSLDTETVRTFLQIMSIYPIGSYARLNNGMIVRVIGSNGAQLTRPVVQVVTGPSGEPADGTQIIDLKKEKLLFIREPLNLQNLAPVFTIG